MGMEENKSKLTSKQGMMSGGDKEGIGHPGHGFKMPAGSNGASSGPALPVSSKVDCDPMSPGSEGQSEEAAPEESGDEGGKINV